MTRSDTLFAETRAKLHALFPTAFPPDGQPRPALAIGIHRALAESGALTQPQARGFLRIWTRRTRYLLALAEGGPRVGLGGQAAGEVAPEHVAQAKEHLRGRRVPAPALNAA